MMAVPARRQHSRFQSLAITHAVMTAGEASMVLALADSFFDPSTYDCSTNADELSCESWLVSHAACRLLLMLFFVRHGADRMVAQGLRTLTPEGAVKGGGQGAIANDSFATSSRNVRKLCKMAKVVG